MANMYCETAWFAGPPAQMKALRKVLTIEPALDKNFVEVHIGGEMLRRGWDADWTETERSLVIGAQMRWDPLGSCFYSISKAVPGLFMASCSSCYLENRYLMVAGFDQHQHFRAEPPVFTDDWEPIRGITDEDGSGALIELTVAGFEEAFEAAVQSFKRGSKTPRRALQILAKTEEAYQEFGPPPDSDYAERLARLEAKLAEDD